MTKFLKLEYENLQTRNYKHAAAGFKQSAAHSKIKKTLLEAARSFNNSVIHR